MRFSRRKLVEEIIELGPFVATNVYKFNLIDNTSVLMVNPRTRFYMEGKVWTGTEVNEKNIITSDAHLIPAKSVKSIVEMMWDMSNSILVEKGNDN